MAYLDLIIKFLTSATLLVGVATGIIAVIQYGRNNALRRVEHFRYLNEKLTETPKYLRIADLLQSESEEISEVSISDKTEFIGLYEIVAISMNSGLIKKEVAFYMFGYYAIKCWNSELFWNDDLEKESSYWHAFRDFVVKMETLERAPAFNPTRATY